MFHTASSKNLSSSTSVNQLGHKSSLPNVQESSISNPMTSKASQFDQEDTQQKLALLVESSSRFWEMADLGFPVSIQDIQNTEPYSPSTSLGKDLIRQSYASSSDRNGSLPSLSSNRSSDGSSTSHSPDTILRQKTLRFTLTPQSMRADESLIYGWQGDQKQTNFEPGSENDVQLQLNDNSNEKVHIQSDNLSNHPIRELSDSEEQTVFSIPVRKESVKLGAQKFKGFMSKISRGREAKKPTYMITSADI